jgi:hypothetical protein
MRTKDIDELIERRQQGLLRSHRSGDWTGAQRRGAIGGDERLATAGAAFVRRACDQQPRLLCSPISGFIEQSTRDAEIPIALAAPSSPHLARSRRCHTLSGSGPISVHGSHRLCRQPLHAEYEGRASSGHSRSPRRLPRVLATLQLFGSAVRRYHFGIA